MSATGAVPVRRVRHQARDCVAVMGVSAGLSGSLALLLLLLSTVGR